MKDMREYEDIIDMPRHVSQKHPPMSMYDRAAQFSPFAALTGHSEAIKETERLTEKRMALSEDEREALDRKFMKLCRSEELCDVEVTYFVEDERKEGGEYRTLGGKIMKVDCARKEIIMEDGRSVPIADITGLEGEIFLR